MMSHDANGDIFARHVVFRIINCLDRRPREEHGEGQNGIEINEMGLSFSSAFAC
jgi:hypothetical protein